MKNPEYKVTELLDILSEEEQVWLYQHDEEKRILFGGAALAIKQSNSPLSEMEVLGELSGNEFTADDGKYVGFIAVNKKTIRALAVKCMDGVVLILSDGIFEAAGKKIEGYWYSKEQPQYIKPRPNELSPTEADQIYALIKQKEKESEIAIFRGSSLSRIDKTIVGSKEYQHEEWLWPEGYAEHYVKQYKVKPSDAFLSFLGWSSAPIAL